MTLLQPHSWPGASGSPVDPRAFARAVRARLPVTLGLALDFDLAADHRGELVADELLALSHAADRRAHEFSTGRMLARRAMMALGLAPGVIARGPGRAPSWPDGCVGSITHADGFVAAGVCRADDLRGLGIDLELANRLRPHLYHKILTARERFEAGGEELIDTEFATVVFSAKESVYKAVNPIVGRFIGFQEVEVVFAGSDSMPMRACADVGRAAPQAGEFRARYIGSHAANRILDSGQGWYVRLAAYVFTLFVIPGMRPSSHPLTSDSSPH